MQKETCTHTCSSILCSTKTPGNKVNAYQEGNGYVGGGIADQGISCSYEESGRATLVDLEELLKLFN